MRLVLLAFALAACSDAPGLHDETACGASWGSDGVNYRCELACEEEPSANQSETCGAVLEGETVDALGRPPRMCNGVFVSDIDGAQHRGCCKVGAGQIKFAECCTTTTDSMGNVLSITCP